MRTIVAAPSTARLARTTAPSHGRRLIVRSGPLDAIARIFSPSTQDNKPLPKGLEQSFSGKVRHHEGTARPFRDGFITAKSSKAGEAEQVPPSGGGGDADAAPDAADAGFTSLVARNFRGDGTEPPASTGVEGWRGDIHDKKRDGFHSRKL